MNNAMTKPTGLAITGCPYAGVMTVDQVKVILGEPLDMWPDSIAADD
jgi:hypothetical protein